jgi:hypothetical protein
VFEVWDRHRQEVVGLATTKQEAISLGRHAVVHFPTRRVKDLIIRPKSEPPIRISKLSPTHKCQINGQKRTSSASLQSFLQ